MYFLITRNHIKRISLHAGHSFNISFTHSLDIFLYIHIYVYFYFFYVALLMSVGTCFKFFTGLSIVGIVGKFLWLFLFLLLFCANVFDESQMNNRGKVVPGMSLSSVCWSCASVPGGVSSLRVEYSAEGAAPQGLHENDLSELFHFIGVFYNVYIPYLLIFKL